MKLFTSTVLAASAGSAIAPAAFASDPAVLGEFAHARLAGYIYINGATGERVVTPAHASRIGDLKWQNDDIAGSCNSFLALDLPSRDEAATGRVKFGASVVHWGDTPGGGEALMNGFDIAYATNIGHDTAGAGIAGLNLINTFIDDYDGVLDPGGSGAAPVAGFIIDNIAGGDSTLGTSLYAGWIYTFDLEGTGFETDVGSTDLDGDGRPDFGYSYSFEQNQTEPKGVVGPFLVRPQSLGGLGTATGCPDQLDWFNDASNELTDYVGGLWFGGGDCSIPRPYASLLLNRYGCSCGMCGVIDYTPDGLIDFGDYLEFLNRYDAQDPAADLNMDGQVDFSDYLEFLNIWDACVAR